MVVCGVAFANNFAKQFATVSRPPKCSRFFGFVFKPENDHEFCDLGLGALASAALWAQCARVRSCALVCARMRSYVLVCACMRLYALACVLCADMRGPPLGFESKFAFTKQRNLKVSLLLLE